MPLTLPSSSGGTPGLPIFTGAQQQRAYLRRLAETNLRKRPEEEDDEGFFGGLIPDIVQDAAAQIGESLLYTLPGLYETGKAITQDVGDLVTEGDITPERIGTIGKQMGQALYQDVRHPRENIGYLLMDILGAASVGAGTVARLGAAGKVGKVGLRERGPLPPPEPSGVRYRPPSPTPLPGGAVDLAPMVSGRGATPAHLRFERGVEPDPLRTQETMLAVQKAALRAPLIPGKLYDARHAKGSRYSVLGVYTRTVEKKGQTYHEFVDAETEKRRTIRDDQMSQLHLNEPTMTAEQAAAKALREQKQRSLEAKAFAEGKAIPTPGEVIFNKQTGERVGVRNESGIVIPDKDPWAHVPEPPKAGDPFYHKETGEKLGVYDEYGELVPDPERLRSETGEKVSAFPEMTPEDAASTEAAQRVQRALKQAGELTPQFKKPYYLEQRGEHHSVGEELPGKSRLIVHPDEANPGRYKVTHQLPGTTRVGRTLATFKDLPRAEIAAIQMGNLLRKGQSPLHIEGKRVEREKAERAEIQALMEEAPAQKLPKRAEFGLTKKNFPNMPEDVLKSVTADLRAAYVETGYQKLPGPVETRDILAKHMPMQEAIQMTRDMFKARGGSGGPSIRNLIGDVTRALVRRPQPGTRQISHLERAPGAQLVPWTDPVTGKHTMEAGVVTRGDVLLSRNALIRTVQNVQLNLMERFPERRIGPLHGLKPSTLKEEVAFQAAEADRIMVLATSAGIFEQTKRAAEEEQQARKGKKKTTKDLVPAIVDQMNMAAKVGALHLKPAYMSANMLGQIWLSLADHAWRPDHIARSVRLQRALYSNRLTGQPDSPLHANRRSQKVKNSMSEGILAATAHETGLFKNVPLIGTEGLRIKGKKVLPGYYDTAEFYNKFLDTPFRDNAFMHEAIRHGFDTPEKVAALVDAMPGTPLHAKFTEVARRANRNIIDYGRLGPNEKRFIRRLIFFYPWFKGATIYGAHFFAEHPVQGALNVGIGRQAAATAEEELGPLPSYLRGAFKVGEREVPGLGKVPRIVNPQAATILGTPGEVLDTAMGALAGDTTEASQLSQHLTPGFSALFAATTHIDPFTGREISPKKSAVDIVAEQFGGTIALTNLFKNMGRAGEIERGELDPEKERILFPYGTGGLNPFKNEAFGRFTLGVAPYSLNPREARSLAAAEARTLESKHQREILKHRDYRDQFAEAGKETGVFDKVPEELAQAFAYRGQKEAEMAALGESLDRDLTQIDRLQAELQVLVRRGVYTEEQARQVLEQMATTDQNQVRSLRRRLNDQYFGAAIISSYKARLNASGATLTVP